MYELGRVFNEKVFNENSFGSIKHIPNFVGAADKQSWVFKDPFVVISSVCIGFAFILHIIILSMLFWFKEYPLMLVATFNYKIGNVDILGVWILLELLSFYLVFVFRENFFKNFFVVFIFCL